MSESLRENCGIAGIYAGSPETRRNLPELLRMMLFAMQHRGQEAAGIAVWNGETIVHYKNLGLVNEVFRDLREVKAFQGEAGIGHVRYSTAGVKKSPVNAQPLVASRTSLQVALAHNGNLSNADHLRQRLEDEGFVATTSLDSELILYLYLREEGQPARRMKRIARFLKGAYALVLLHNGTLVAVRDPYGFRPLSFGFLPDGSVAVASETVALAQIGAREITELDPGLVLTVQDGKPVYERFALPQPAHCVFELIYFSRPDSRVFGHSTYLFRKETGRLLARKETYPVDLVIPVPDSGIAAALGYAEASGKPLEFGLIRSHFTGRSFIQPTPRDREQAVFTKLLPISDILKGKRVAVVDDSIVRGTTSRAIVRLLRQAGAREIHFRVASPPIIAPCYFGIDIPTYDELLAARLDRDMGRIADFLEADSVIYLTPEELRSCLLRPERFCYSCFTDRYPEGTLP